MLTDLISNNSDNKILNTLLNIDPRTTNYSEIYNINSNELDLRHRTIIHFINSLFFENIPFVNISAGLFACLFNEVRLNQYLVDGTIKEKILKELRGTVYDIEHLSIYAPYCDVIWTEKRMGKHLNHWVNHPLGTHMGRIYSSNNLEELNIYLEELEGHVSAEHLDYLKFAYSYE